MRDYLCCFRENCTQRRQARQVRACCTFASLAPLREHSFRLALHFRSELANQLSRIARVAIEATEEIGNVDLPTRQDSSAIEWLTFRHNSGILS